MEICNRRLGGRVLAMGATLILGSSAVAQAPVYDVNGDAQHDRLGAAMAPAGDFNNDTYPDFIVGAPEDFLPFTAGPGYARVYSGLDGSELHTFSGTVTAELFGFAVDGAGDVDQDGFDDVIIGAPYESSAGSLAGMARIFSGQTALPIHTFYGDANGDGCGYAVAGLGDVNGDGHPDVAVGYRDSDINGVNSGLVRIFSGFNGMMLQELPGLAAGDRLGVSVANAGDVDGDGADDVVAGSYFAGVYVFSGGDGSELLHVPSPSSNDFYGWDVAGVGDVNGDHTPDLLVGAFQDSAFVQGPGYAQVLSGADGSVIYNFSGVNNGERFGISVSSAGDFNGDTSTDFLIGADEANHGNAIGYAKVYSGFDGALLKTYVGDADDCHLGFSVAALGDVNGDLKPEVGVGQPGDSDTGTAAGSAQVYSGEQTNCGPVQSFCSSLPNSTGGAAIILHSGSNSVQANDLVLLAFGCPPNQNGVFFYGPNPLQLPFGNGIRCAGGGVIRFPVITTGAGGIAAWAVDIPNPPTPDGQIVVGSIWHFQFWFRDPAGGGSQTNTTDGLRVPFCP